MFSVFPDFILQLNLGFNVKVRISSLLNIAYTIILNQECRHTAFARQ